MTMSRSLPLAFLPPPRLVAKALDLLTVVLAGSVGTSARRGSQSEPIHPVARIMHHLPHDPSATPSNPRTPSLLSPLLFPCALASSLPRWLAPMKRACISAARQPNSIDPLSLTPLRQTISSSFPPRSTLLITCSTTTPTRDKPDWRHYHLANFTPPTAPTPHHARHYLAPPLVHPPGHPTVQRPGPCTNAPRPTVIAI